MPLKASEEPHSSKRTQDVIVRDIIPTPQKNKSDDLEALDFG
jgi:hypothetical protein